MTRSYLRVISAEVSGRSRDKIGAFVGDVAERLWVAGAHGYDIAGPEGSGVAHRPAEEYAGSTAGSTESRHGKSIFGKSKG